MCRVTLRTVAIALAVFLAPMASVAADEGPWEGRFAWSSAVDDVMVWDPLWGEPVRVIAGGSGPALSPRGYRIAYVAEPPGNPSMPGDGAPDNVRRWDLYVMDVDGRNATRLTEPEASPHPVAGVWHTSPAWSPDGSRIAFGRYTRFAPYDDESWDSGLYVIDSDGSNLVRLPEQCDVVSNPTWSPDGTRIAYTCVVEVEGSEIWVTSIDGSGNTQLTGRVRWSYSQDPAWSPGGSRIAFSSWRNGQSDVYLMDTDGSEQTNLTAHPARDQTPVWSVGGGAVAFVSNRDRNGAGIWAVEPGGDPYLLFDAGSGGVEQLDFGSRPDRFVDVPEGGPFVGDITWLREAGLTHGCNPPFFTRYCPVSLMTRGQMAAFLVRALGLRGDGTDWFTDDDDSIFEGDINALGTAGITKGCNPPRNDHFCPSRAVTRGELAALLVRALGLTDAGKGDLFVDDDGSIFEHHIDVLGTARITKGCNPPTNDAFCPADQVTREQAAAFLHRALQ